MVFAAREFTEALIAILSDSKENNELHDKVKVTRRVNSLVVVEVRS